MDTRNRHFLPRMQKWQTKSASTDAEVIATADGLKNLKWLDSLTIEIGLNLQTCDLYQDNLSASKVIKRLNSSNIY